MAARLGQVLYSTGCILGALMVSFAFAPLVAPGEDTWIVALMCAGAGVVVWLIGHACRSILNRL